LLYISKHENIRLTAQSRKSRQPIG